ncbi:hypothetical protein PWT90_08021 [Aphanocladium album]|nr:hypothetical protein PWT90_08021 [Aphanocladium album]
MAKTKQISSDNIVNLGSLIEVKLVDILRDGRLSTEIPSSFVVEVRRKTDSSRPARSAGKCVLKTFPKDRRNQEVFRHEVQAYSKLAGQVTYNSAQEAADALFDTLSELKPKHGWPRCLGYMAVPTEMEDYEFEWTDMAEAAVAKRQTQNALLLEYIPGLEPVTAKMLNPVLIEDILDTLAQLQEEGIHHRANINPAVWPKPGIRNIYVQCSKPGARGVPFIANFGHAQVLGDSERERRLMEAEMEDLEHHLKRMMEGKLLVDEIFRILGDLSHAASKGILIFAIHNNRSAEGVSLITQILYALVFCTRYLDLFHTAATWNVMFKISYILSSFYILGIMQWVFPRSRERELSWKLGAIILGGTAALSPFAMLIFKSKKQWGFFPWAWTFSEILESVCVLPQLLLLRQTTVPTVIDSFYLVALGSYRALYCLNWFVRMFDSSKPDAISVIFGVIQTALYADFAWVYYTRQRVKLRGGGVVDADDLRNGYLVQRIFGRTLGQHNEEHDEEAGLNHDEPHGSRPKWGSRGISVSADEGVFEDDEHGEGSRGLDDAVDPDAKMQDPDDLAKALDDDDDEDEDAPLRGQSSGSAAAGIRSGDEWRD